MARTYRFKSNNKSIIGNTEVELKKLSNLIDWAHQNDLEFHVTELDYFIEDSSESKEGFKKSS